MFFFFNDTATTEIYTLSLHDALPISRRQHRRSVRRHGFRRAGPARGQLTLAGGGRRTADRFDPVLADPGGQIGRAHLRNPVTYPTRIPPSAFTKKKNIGPAKCPT